MLQGFKNFIKEEGLFNSEHKLLLALSGGEDSVCLFHLLCDAGYSFSVAHCNFKLRGLESDADEHFVNELAKRKQIVCHNISFNTSEISAEMGTGIQETARKLRYDWFFGLMKEHGYHKLCTAHHRTDHLETMLINILRGSGVKGLHGIPVNENRIARPLMFTTKEEIDNYMKSNQLEFREDRSNASDYYLRNALRHFVLPALKNVRSDAEQRFYETAVKVKSYENIADELLQKAWEQCCKKSEGRLTIDFSQLTSIENKVPFLYYNLQPYGFTFRQIESIINTEQVGKRILSEKFMLLTEREHFIVVPISTLDQVGVEMVIEACPENTISIGDLKLEMRQIPNAETIDFRQKHHLYLNADKQLWPLKIRGWREGDKLIPMGMQGYKKVSDILTDRKVPNHLRKQFLVIENIDNEIIALLPDVIHERYKIQQDTIQILSIGIKIAAT